MLKTIITSAVVSKGYQNAPALRFSENGESVRFRIGKRVYDPHEESGYHWVNLSVKAFGTMCERVKKMQVAEGSFLNLIGRLDEEAWTDKKTNEEKRAMVVILEDVEYASNGGKQKDGQSQNTSDSGQTQAPAEGNWQTAPASGQPQSGGVTSNNGSGQANPMDSENFTGFEPFAGGNMFPMG